LDEAIQEALAHHRDLSALKKNRFIADEMLIHARTHPFGPEVDLEVATDKGLHFRNKSSIPIDDLPK